MSADAALAQLTAGLQRVARAFDERAHVPLLCEGAQVGWLRRAHAQRLAAWPEVFRRDAHGVRIAETLTGADARTAAIDVVVHALHEKGEITGWRNERYAVVTAFDAPPLFDIERAAARYFGTTTYAAHANGYCGGGANDEMWLARRAATKPIDPNMWDNVVGGGMSAGVAPLDTIVREAWEEAGIPEALARGAVAAGTVELLREVPEGVQSEVVFVHDLELPRDFTPVNRDGEVAEFRRMPLNEVIVLIEADTTTVDASLVMMRFLQQRNDL